MVVSAQENARGPRKRGFLNQGNCYEDQAQPSVSAAKLHVFSITCGPGTAAVVAPVRLKMRQNEAPP